MNIKEILSKGLEREYEVTLTASEMDEKFQLDLWKLQQANILVRLAAVPMSVGSSLFGMMQK